MCLGQWTGAETGWRFEPLTSITLKDAETDRDKLATATITSKLSDPTKLRKFIIQF
jgi:hypothetical protein